MYPILFKLGPLNLYTYGLLYAIGLLAGSELFAYQARKSGIKDKIIYDYIFVLFIAIIVGARLLFVFLNLPDYLTQPWKIFYFWEGGMVFYGGLITGLLVTIWFVKQHSLSLWQIADWMAPVIVLGHAIGRIGCFFAGCCYGRETHLPWAITFHNECSLAPLNVPLHPTQLYEAIANLVLFLVLWFNRTRPKFAGGLFFGYLTISGIIRFVIEFFRGDERGFVWLGLPVTQWIALLLIFTGICGYILLSNKADKSATTN